MIDYQRKQAVGFYTYYSYQTDMMHGMLTLYDENLLTRWDSRDKNMKSIKIPEDKHGTSLFIDERRTRHNII